MSSCRSSRGRAGCLPAMSPCWRTWVTGVQSWQRSYAGCLAYPRWVMAGGDAQAHGVATRSKALLQGPERWAPYHQGPTSWDQEPGKEETWAPGGTLTLKSRTFSQGSSLFVLRGGPPVPTLSLTPTYTHKMAHRLETRDRTPPFGWSVSAFKGRHVLSARACCRASHTVGIQCRAVR